MAVRGRPRSFDRDVALDRVMRVFWAKGYECAQINDFTAAIGITPPSFYAAFGSKEQAFREAVDYYIATIGGAPIDALEAAPAVHDGVRAMLELSADQNFTCQSGGCMISISSIQCKPENQPVKDFLADVRRVSYQRLLARFERAVREGDLPSDTDAVQMTEFFHALLQSMSYEARDGNSRAAVQKIIDLSMRTLPQRLT